MKISQQNIGWKVFDLNRLLRTKKPYIGHYVLKGIGGIYEKKCYHVPTIFIWKKILKIKYIIRVCHFVGWKNSKHTKNTN